MKRLILLLLLLTSPLFAETSHHVLHAQSGNYREGILRLDEVDKTLTLYTTDKQSGAGTIEVAEFIDKTYRQQPTSLSLEGKIFPLKVKNLRYNPYNERLLLEIETSPFEEGKTFGHATLIFY